MHSSRARFTPGAGLLIAVMGAGCSGVIGEAAPPRPDDAPPGSPSAPRASGGASTGAPSPTPATPTATAAPDAPAAGAPAAAPDRCAGAPADTLSAAPIRRLTIAEVARTMRDLVALPLTATPALDVPNESRVDGFDNNLAAQALTDRHILGLVDATEKLTQALLADTKRRDQVVGCAPTGAARATCTRAFIQRFGRRALRRPLPADEIDRFAALAATADADADPYAGVELVMRAMLGSPSFLFVVENGTPDPKRPGVVRLTGYEVATRLSYLLVGSGPGDALLDAAAAGKLDAPDGIAAAARDLLADPRAAAVRRGFATSWLQTDALAAITPDAKLYPKWSEPLRAAMLEETGRFLDDLLSRPDGNLLDVVSADWSFVNDALGRHYGVTAPAAGTWARASFPQGQRAAGVLTQATLLTMTAPHPGVEPIKRGQFVRQVLLCQRLPSPPANVPSIDKVVVPATASDRDRLAAHRSNPACAGCHRLMDDVGFGFSAYDGIGAYRTRDAGGNAIDQHGTISGFDAPDFEGPRALGTKLRQSPDLPACVATQIFRFALARTETSDESCTVRAIADAFQRGGQSWPALVDALVRSEAFRTRRPAITTGGMN